ncbi:hypothetical protein LCGC14_3102960, partial [marine sediment metagenome]
MKKYIDSEYKRLRTAMIHEPHPTIVTYGQGGVKAVLHLRTIDYPRLVAQYKQLIIALRKNGVDVCISMTSFEGWFNYNMMYLRDLFFSTPKGVIVCGMATDIRRSETEHIERILKGFRIPIVGTVNGSSTFEGADAIWINKDVVMVGVGGRTNT